MGKMTGWVAITAFIWLAFFAGPSWTTTTTRVVIGQDGQLVCSTKSEQIRWTVDGKNITKGTNKRYE